MTKLESKLKIYLAEPMKYTPFSQRTFLSQLSQEGFILVKDTTKADLFVSRKIQHLIPLINKYGKQKEYLIWTHEPRLDTNFNKIKYLQNSIKIHIMNCYTQDVYCDNYKYAAIMKEKSLQPPNYHEFSREKGKKIAMIASARFSGWQLIQNNVNIDLSVLRTKIAMNGYKLGKVDLYGPGWPRGSAIENFRRPTHENRRNKKVNILEKYHFSLCFENTNIEYYCTEKIWECLAAGCLPIYYGNRAIYEDFPRRSFLDYNEFQDSNALFDYIDKMDIQEYNIRLQLCLDTCKKILNKKGPEHSSKKLKSKILYKLKAIWLNQPKQKQKLNEIYQSKLVWLRQVQKEIINLQSSI